MQGSCWALGEEKWGCTSLIKGSAGVEGGGATEKRGGGFGKRPLREGKKEGGGLKGRVSPGVERKKAVAQRKGYLQAENQKTKRGATRKKGPTD